MLPFICRCCGGRIEKNHRGFNVNVCRGCEDLELPAGEKAGVARSAAGCPSRDRNVAFRGAPRQARPCRRVRLLIVPLEKFKRSA